MAEERLLRQSFHAALIVGPLGSSCLKHFATIPAEMLQEIRAARVDLGKKRP